MDPQLEPGALLVSSNAQVLGPGDLLINAYAVPLSWRTVPLVISTVPTIKTTAPLVITNAFVVFLIKYIILKLWSSASLLDPNDL